jgi:hypothetical protein
MLAKAFDVSVSPPSPVPPQSPPVPPSTPMHSMDPMHPSYTPTQQAAQQRITSAAAPPAKQCLSINTSPTPPLTNKSKRTMQANVRGAYPHAQKAARSAAPSCSTCTDPLSLQPTSGSAQTPSDVGCPSNARMSKAAKSEGVGGLEGWTPIDRFDCINCLEMKGRKAPFQKFAQKRSYARRAWSLGFEGPQASNKGGGISISQYSLVIALARDE